MKRKVPGRVDHILSRKKKVKRKKKGSWIYTVYADMCLYTYIVIISPAMDGKVLCTMECRELDRAIHSVLQLLIHLLSSPSCSLAELWIPFYGNFYGKFRGPSCGRAVPVSLHVDVTLYTAPKADMQLTLAVR